MGTNKPQTFFLSLFNDGDSIRKRSEMIMLAETLKKSNEEKIEFIDFSSKPVAHKTNRVSVKKTHPID